jgi:hypothetical protein
VSCYDSRSPWWRVLLSKNRNETAIGPDTRECHDATTELMPSSRPSRTRNPRKPSPPKPRRNMSRARKRSGGSFSRRLGALCETAGAASDGAGRRPTYRRNSGSHRFPGWLHRSRHFCHESCGVTLHWEKGNHRHQPSGAKEPPLPRRLLPLSDQILCCAAIQDDGNVVLGRNHLIFSMWLRPKAKALP